MRHQLPRSPKPRKRIQPPPGKSEAFWNRKAGELDELTGPVVGASLVALEARLDAIDAEHARRWPNAYVTPWATYML